MDSCGFRRLLFSVGLTSDRLLSDLRWFLYRSCLIGTFGSFRRFMGISASYVHIFDNKGSAA